MLFMNWAFGRFPIQLFQETQNSVAILYETDIMSIK